MGSDDVGGYSKQMYPDFYLLNLILPQPLLLLRFTQEKEGRLGTPLLNL